MKNIYKVICLGLGLFLASCEKFLEENPKSLISTTNFYQTNADALAAVNGVYAAMRPDVTGSIDPIWFAEVTTDDGALGGTPVGERVELDNLVYSAQHSFIQRIWNTAYNVINRANTVLANVDSAKVTPALVRRVHAESKFLRAFYYSRLVQFFGDVPLLLEPSTSANIYPPRTPRAQIFAQIIEDLKYAEANLENRYAYNDPINGGRATAGAAKALLGYVYVVMAGAPTNDASKWQLAIDKLNEVITNKAVYGYELMPVYRDIFDVTKKTTNTEYVFYYNGTSGLSASLLAYTRLQNFYFTFTTVVPTTEVRTTLYETADLRRTVNMGRKSGNTIVPITNTTGTPIITKYITSNLANSADSNNDFHIIRYSDVLLLYAEALIERGAANDLTAALDIINQIRRTHGGTTLPLLTFTSQDDLRQKLRVERRKELLFEGHRWYDLVRWGIFVPTIKAHLAAQNNRPITDYNYVNDNVLLLPLPNSDFVANPNLRPQNPGY
ncbi:RagB/SusD family nutrient uptake outer membrane protein [Pedobacter glucosidilyticus]|uniref:RagB/SusD family nutrient uptake outer membrane protein n=1 Tax=Pedobacter glucosidilyticus TaxID=1122941 RepID=UPI0004057123|nr:RagB/SusD family nutrient uptake outer membrane protein [Pedobacter glucosidilyticus]